MTDATLDEAVKLPPALLQRLATLVGKPDPAAEGELWDAERLKKHAGRSWRPHGCAAHEAWILEGARGDLKQRLRRQCAGAGVRLRGIVRGAEGRAGAVSPAAQWIVDNFHVISDHLNDIPLRLTRKAWRELPADAQSRRR